jgi:DNA-binding transcriptional regulator YdaS (Cro superfamily)
MDHISRAAKILGSNAKLAEKVGVSPQAIGKAIRSQRVSTRLAMAIEKATDGAVSRSDLRPDIWQPDQEKRAA